MATVVVPFRGANGKSRLALPEPERRSLALSMLRRVLGAAAEVGEVLLVTDDEEARSLAPRWVADPGGGQGAAVAAALVAAGAPTLVVNADLPRAEAEDLRALLAAIPERGIAVVEADDGTTNALGLSSPELFAPLYGPGSADRFREHAYSLGAAAVDADLPRLAEDLDELTVA
jgi:2-phospho-L-lactate/phosphoenolpyruvate guanylyltransferase